MTKTPADIIHDQILSKLALNYKMITYDQYIELVDIFEQEKETENDPTLQEVMVKHNFLDSADIRFLYSAQELLTERRRQKRFGQIAIRKGLLNQEEIEKAVSKQKKDRRRIGKILMDLFCITQEQCDDVLDTQKTIVINLPDYDEVALNVSEIVNETINDDSNNYKLNISEDELVAVVNLKDVRNPPEIEELKTALAESGVIYGIISDEKIKEKLRYINLGLTSFIIAKGKECTEGEPGELILHFTPREKLAGVISDDGTIDYKDRGEIPVIKKGELLAERIEMTRGLPGTTIFGKTIDIDEVEEAAFLSGPGTEMNSSRDKIFATCDGEPTRNLDGSLCVLSELVVDNVDFETGNLSYDGNIFVKGKINPNFEVVGKSLQASEINDAKINIEGDVTVEQGIIGATIKAMGDISATYLKNCKVLCGGTVKIDKEIIDSEIYTGVNCQVHGNILTSQIYAGHSVAAYSIGSDRSGSNHIEIGVVERVTQQLTDPINEEINKQTSEIAALVEKQGIIMNLMAVIVSVIKEIRRDKEKFEAELNSVKAFISRMDDQDQRKIESSATDRINDIESKIITTTDVLGALVEDKKFYKKQLLELNHEIKMLREGHEKNIRKCTNIYDRIQSDDKIPIIKVVDAIYSGTKLVSPKTQLILKDTFPAVTIREVYSKASSGNQNEENYYLEITKG